MTPLHHIPSAVSNNDDNHPFEGLVPDHPWSTSMLTLSDLQQRIDCWVKSTSEAEPEKLMAMAMKDLPTEALSSGKEGSSHVIPMSKQTPAYMVIYSTQMSVKHFLEVLADFIELHHKNYQMEVMLWIDIFCLPETTDPQRYNSLFEQACKYFGEKMVMLSPWKHAEVFAQERSLYQLFISSKAETSWEVGMSVQERQDFQLQYLSDPLNALQSLQDIANKAEEHVMRFRAQKQSGELACPLIWACTESELTAQQFFRILNHGIHIFLLEYFLVHIAQVCYSLKSWLGSEMLLAASTKSTSMTLANLQMEAREEQFEMLLVHLVDQEVAMVFAVVDPHTQSNSTQCADANYLIIYLKILSKWYLYQERIEDAEQVMVKVIEMQQAELGSHHKDTLHSTFQLASIFATSHKYSMAELFYTSYLHSLQESDQTTSRELLIACQHIGNFFYSQQCYDKAEEMYLSCHQQAINVHDRFHHVSLHTANMLCNVYVQQHKYLEGIQLAEECVEIATTLHHETHPLVQQTKQHLQEIYIGQRMQEEREAAIAIPLQEVITLQGEAMTSSPPREIVQNQDRKNVGYTDFANVCTIA